MVVLKEQVCNVVGHREATGACEGIGHAGMGVHGDLRFRWWVGVLGGAVAVGHGVPTFGGGWHPWRWGHPLRWGVCGC